MTKKVVKDVLLDTLAVLIALTIISGGVFTMFFLLLIFKRGMGL